MIIITGAAGFIGSNLVHKLNEEGYVDLILVDDFTDAQKNKNFEGLKFIQCIDRNLFHQWLDQNHQKVVFVFHLGARTDTTEFDTAIFDELNLNYSKKIWKQCSEYALPLVYASSAATYGNGELGYDDAHELIPQLKPLNPYGASKQQFDLWVLQQENKPPFWAGLKFFNVYGPKEYHKGRMASVVFHAYHQIKTTGAMKLFRSHHPDYQDGEQKRDFIYVKDVVSVCYYLMKQKKHSAIYNLGTGQARTFIDLVRAVFQALGREPTITFIDTPEDIRNNYQYFTEAKMEKLLTLKGDLIEYDLENGISDYVKNYLVNAFGD